MAKIVKKPVAPIYAVAVLWVVWGLLFPLHKPIHFVAAAAVSVIVFCVGKAIWPDKTYETPDPEPVKKEEPKTTGNPDTMMESALRISVAPLWICWERSIFIPTCFTPMTGRRQCRWYI